MMNFEIMSKLIKERLSENKVDVFRVKKIGELLKTGILFDDISEFFRLITTANINRVFIYEHFEFLEDYYITEETLKDVVRYENDDFIDFIIPQINNYNSKIEKLDFKYPSMVIAFCICDNQFFFMFNTNERLLDGEELVEPETMLKIICDSNESQRCEILKKRRDLIDSLQEELRQQILKDDKFKVCTNQDLRRRYAAKLFSKLEKRFEPLKSIMYQHNLAVLSREGREFIEVIWREILDSKKKQN